MRKKRKTRVLMALGCSYENSELSRELHKAMKALGVELEVVNAFDGLQASKELCDNPGAFDLVIYDSEMPYGEVFGAVLSLKMTSFAYKEECLFWFLQFQEKLFSSQEETS